MGIHVHERERLIATGVYHAMEVASRPVRHSDLEVQSLPSDGDYEPAVDFVFKTGGYPAAMFGRADIVVIHEWLGKWLEDNPLPEGARSTLSDYHWQGNDPGSFVR